MTDDQLGAASTNAYLRQAREREFAKIGRRELAAWPDEKLAAWQAKYPPDSAQFILAQYEWNRRLTADQIAATMTAARGQAWFGIIGLFIGAALTLLGALVLRLLPQ